MKIYSTWTSGMAIVAFAFSGTATAQTCQTSFTKGGLQTTGCASATAPISAPISSFGTGTVTAPTTLTTSNAVGLEGGSLVAPGVVPGATIPAPIASPVVEPTVVVAPEPIAPVAVQEPALLAVEPIIGEDNIVVAAGNDFFWAGAGVGAALLGEAFTYNGVGGADTFGAGFTEGEDIWGLNAGMGARFGSFFMRGNGFYALGTDEWVDDSATLAAVNGGSLPMVAPYDVNVEANGLRGGIAGGYSFDLGESGMTGLSADIGPSVAYLNHQVNVSIDDGVNVIEEQISATTTALGATLGVSLKPDWSNNFAVWGHAAVHGYYGFNSMAVTQNITSGGVSVSLTQADAPAGTAIESNQVMYGGEIAANVGYRLSDNLTIGGGVYANYLSDIAIVTDYALSSTSLIDVGVRASVALSF